MNPVRLVGSIALAVGGGLLLSELFLGQAALMEITGAQWATLHFFCGTLIAGGGVAIRLCVKEIKESSQNV